MHRGLSKNAPAKDYSLSSSKSEQTFNAFLSQLPSFHSLRHINLVSLLLSLGYTILVSAACIRAGLSKNAPAKDYSLSSSKSEQTFNAFLSQLPSFHSLRHINLVSLLLSLGYTILVSAACIRAGLSKNAPAKDYSLSSSKSEQTFNAFLSISILASVFGNGILPFFFENLTKLYY